MCVGEKINKWRESKLYWLNRLVTTTDQLNKTMYRTELERANSMLQLHKEQLNGNC